ncbi:MULTISPECIES: DUF3918 family protein [unclassified Bacillus (in: firmicutes)]|nr:MULTISPECIES: DUF3918 family protein [unclassified Bacillus (in: firmicutes)]PEJ47592.1 hypothetical protein CN692_24850 [Bacillus sp. AFS002410]PEL14106.1 hypothetical protein CN601_00740 [Bacillus sp. AFS017336]QKE75539.1 DUF3918 family protein [Arthrobacter citreus]
MARKSSLLGLGLGAGALAMKLAYDNKWLSSKNMKRMRKSLKKML